MEFQRIKKQLSSEVFGNQSNMTEPAVGAQKGRVYPVSSEPQIFGDHELKLAESRRDIKILSDHLSKLVTQFEEFRKSSQFRMDRLQLQLQQNEHRNELLKTELIEKTQSLNQKLSERRTLDLKTQDLIDRHNQIVKGYEARLVHLMKLISEKDQQMLTAQASLNGAKMEIARLKRL